MSYVPHLWIIFFVIVVRSITFPESNVAVPLHLLELGDDIFGSRSAVLNVIANMSTPRLYRFGGVRSSHYAPRRGVMAITLTQFKGDNTVPRLVKEFGGGDKYALRNISRGKDSLMLDIGANVGLVSLYASKLNQNLLVIAFEVVPTTYFAMRCNLHLNKIRIFNESNFGGDSRFPTGGVFPVFGGVVGDGSENSLEVRFTNTQSQLAFVTSTTSPGPTREGALSRARVKAYHLLPFLSDLFKPDGLPPIDLLKIDCEGCEFSVLPSIRNIFVDRNAVRAVTGEFHVALTDKHSPTIADKPLDELVGATIEVLQARGCSVTSWHLLC